jgi:hypothetical protein
MTFTPFGDKLWAKDGLKVQQSGQGSFTVIGPEEHLVHYPEVGYPLRPVNDGEENISRKVAFAHYQGCGDSIFFKYDYGFRVPSRCPRGDGGYLEAEDLPK